MADDILSGGASASIGAAPQDAPQIDPKQIITQLLQRMQQPQGNGGQSSTSFGPSIVPPQPPPNTGGNAPGVFQNRPGGYNSRGEAQRDKNSTIFQNVGNLVGSFAKAEQAKKQQHVERTSSLLFNALQGLDEAKAAGNQDAIKHNASIINNLLDPTTTEGKKNIKMFQKAFDINLFGDSKHKDSPEQKGLMKAFGELNPIAQKFMSQQPMRQGLDPGEQAKAQAIRDKTAPSADAQATLQGKMLEALAGLQKNQATNETRENVADQNNQTKKDIQAARDEQKELDRAQKFDEFKQRLASNEKIATMRMAQTRQIASQSLALRDKAINAGINDKETSLQIKTLDDLQKEYKNVESKYKAASDNVAKLDKNTFEKFMSSEDYYNYQTDQATAGADMQRIANQMKVTKDYLNNKLKIQDFKNKSNGVKEITPGAPPAGAKIVDFTH